MVDVIPGKRGVRLFCGSILLLARTLQAESPLQYVGHSFHLKRRLNFKSVQKVSENLILSHYLLESHSRTGTSPDLTPFSL